MPFKVSSLRTAAASLEPVSSSGSDSEVDFNYGLVSVVEPFDIFGTPGNDFVDLHGKNPGSGRYFSLQLGSGDDFAFGSEFSDQIDGEDGHDQLQGSGGNDTLLGGVGNDLLAGEEGNDILDGGDDNDYLYGGDGADALKGGSGNDQLWGQAGDDVLEGGLGSDVLMGGGGADRFVLAENDAADVIHGFSAVAGCKIDIAALLDRFTEFAGATAAEAFSQGYFYLVQHGTSGNGDLGTTVYIDPNGGAHGGGDFAAAELNGIAAADLTSLPFIV